MKNRLLIRFFCGLLYCICVYYVLFLTLVLNEEDAQVLQLSLRLQNYSHHDVEGQIDRLWLSYAYARNEEREKRQLNESILASPGGPHNRDS